MVPSVLRKVLLMVSQDYAREAQAKEKQKRILNRPQEGRMTLFYLRNS